MNLRGTGVKRCLSYVREGRVVLHVVVGGHCQMLRVVGVKATNRIELCRTQASLLNNRLLCTLNHLHACMRLLPLLRAPSCV
ncbi:hypothetical protein M404DRAFT_637334 [Pisolithus tinctorius Marx 270]|uniref:Uncharacterized protein n=1 Tax=Pisolithus tinctorius Marx 270 TaxID=870435 RepID=A0A0C3P6A0_PISTI|nr:hypothetical protein M404DRAFT_637334 [Pisolithus tinctorius Marx 270]